MTAGETAPAPADELTALREFLGRQRELVVWEVADCSADVLQRQATASGMTALGIVRHLGEVERSWWLDDVLGRDCPPPGRAGAVADGTDTARIVADYAAACAECDAAIEDLALDAHGVGTTAINVRWVYLHLIEETARHLGHLDLLRELADGAVGEDPL